MEVNFKANLITKTQVLKRNKISGKYSPTEVNFVKLNRTSPADTKTLKKIKYFWPFSLASDIYRKSSDNNSLVEVYALTTQEKNLEKLNPRKILGLAETNKIKSEIITIEYLQTNPNYIKDEKHKQPLYKNIGTTILNSFKNFETIRTIKLNPIFSAIDFYEKNDFKIDPTEDIAVIWRKE